jgi:hypothetical protein
MLLICERSLTTICLAVACDEMSLDIHRKYCHNVARQVNNGNILLGVICFAQNAL